MPSAAVVLYENSRYGYSTHSYDNYHDLQVQISALIEDLCNNLYWKDTL